MREERMLEDGAGLYTDNELIKLHNKEHQIIEHGLCFQTDRVKAILAGRQTQDRRPITSRNKYDWQVGDQIWVRETWRTAKALDMYSPRMTGCKSPFQYAAGMKSILHGNIIDKWQPWGKWHPSIHMPRWVARIILEITAIRKETVQEISQDDQRAEGIVIPSEWCVNGYKRTRFGTLWDSIYHKRGYGWDTNPDVRASTFKIIEVKN